MTTRAKVLLLSPEVGLTEADTASAGSNVHLAATLEGLKSSFEVLPLLADAEPAATVRSAPARTLRRFVPGWLSGLRQDLRAIGADRRFGAAAIAAGRPFAPDVVYARSEYFSFSSVRVARALQAPLVLEVNGLLSNDVKAIYRSPLEPAGRVLEKRKHRRAAAIVTVSPGLARLLEASGVDPGKIFVVPNSISPDRITAQERAATGSRIVVGWVGHLMPWHFEAIELLLECAPEVVRRVPPLEFLVIGGGPGLETLEERARELGLAGRFRFTGAVSHAEIPARLAEVDIAVIPAVFEYAFPVKIVEFGAAGLAVVAPRSPSLDEQIEPHLDYEPFTPDDRADLVATLVRLAEDPARRQELGDALRRKVAAEFTWTATGVLLADLIGGLLVLDAPG